MLSGVAIKGKPGQKKKGGGSAIDHAAAEDGAIEGYKLQQVRCLPDYLQ